MTLHGWTEAGLEWVREGYAKSLVRLLDRSVVVLIVTAVALVAIVVFIVPKITFSFAPQSDNGSITVNVSMHNGAALASTNAMTGTLEKYLLQQPAVKTVQTVVLIGARAGPTHRRARPGERPGSRREISHVGRSDAGGGAH